MQPRSAPDKPSRRCDSLDEFAIPPQHHRTGSNVKRVTQQHLGELSPEREEPKDGVFRHGYLRALTNYYRHAKSECTATNPAPRTRHSHRRTGSSVRAEPPINSFDRCSNTAPGIPFARPTLHVVSLHGAIRV